MKYRTKLFVAFVTIAFTSSVLSLLITEIETKKFFFKEFQSKAISIAASVASQLDGNLVKQIKIESDEKLPAYAQIREQLKKFRDANRRTDVYVKFIYTMRPDPNDPQKFLFGVDPEEKTEDFSHAGTENPGATGDYLYDHLKENYSHGEMIKDPWGTWLTGYAPIYDSMGNYVGSVGVDVSADFVNSELNRLLFFALTGLIASIVFSFVVANFLAKRISRVLKALIAATVEISKGDFSYRIKIDTHDEFGDLAKAVNQMTEGLEEKEHLKTGFAHYVSQHVLEKIIKEKGGPSLGGERRKITVLFSDVRDFTHIAESMPPEKVVSLLNEYFKTMIDIILKYNGLLDKLIGDRIMAEFGALIEDPEQEKNAVRTAIEMMNSLTELREKWKKEGIPSIEIGIGIHTGEAIIGTIGSEQRMEFTAIGDTVNVASRLENVTKEGKYSIIVSESTFKALYHEFPSKHLGLLNLPGKELPVNAYAILLPPREDVPPPQS